MQTIGFRAVRIWLVGTLAVAGARGDVVVIDNRSRQTIQFAVRAADGDRQATFHTVAAGDVLPVPTRGRVDVAFLRGEGKSQYRLDANSAYYFLGEGAELDLRAIGLGGDAQTLSGRDLGAESELESIGKLPVMILTDDDQRYTREFWESQLRRRFKAASQILEKHCRIQLEVVAVDTWDSDDQVDDFQQSLLEFAREVRPAGARLAVGFTSQYSIVQGKVRLGGTYGPFQSHILIREWAQHISEAERLELLVHELGHHLGAVHSPEPSSVMRPILGDRRARRAEFPIRFDPVNTLAMYLVGEEIRLRHVHSFARVSTATKMRLRQIYAAVSQALPSDPAAAKYLELLGGDLSTSGPK
jgi:Metallo-peptidase family M12